MQTIRRTTTIERQAEWRDLFLDRKPETFSAPELADLLMHLESDVHPAIKEAVFPIGANAIDVSGTGGSGKAKFNTSTSIAFVLASNGMPVIKFGNRSITGRSGSLDFLAALGIPDTIPADKLRQLFDKTGLIFLSAHDAYPSLGTLREDRKKLGRATILNFIGPLLNPARPAYRVLGVSNERMQAVLSQLLVRDERLVRATTVRSKSNVDELDAFGSNSAYLIDRRRNRPTIVPLQCEPKLAIHQRSRRLPEPEMNPIVNAALFEAIIYGSETNSEEYHNLVLNSAIAFFTVGAATSIDEGCELAQKLINSGCVAKQFELTRRVYHELA